MMSLIGKFISFSIAVYIVAFFLPGITLKKAETGVFVALVYGIVHFFLFWILNIITLPFKFLSLGLFVFVINGFLLWLTDKLVDDFEIKDIKTTMIASLLISFITTVLGVIVYTDSHQVFDRFL